MDGRVGVFSNGIEYLDWNDANCCTCARYHTEGGEVIEPYCELEQALCEASIDDGTVSVEITDRLGVPRDTRSNWRCKEHQPIREDGGEFHKPAMGQLPLPLVPIESESS